MAKTVPFVATILLFGAFAQRVLGDTLVTTQGPFTWTDACGGEMQLTVRVYKDVAAYPGLYKWDYQIDNVSVTSSYGDALVNGIADFWTSFSQDVPELGNTYAPSNWDYLGDGTYFAFYSEQAPDPPPDGYYHQVYALQSGNTLHLGFTSFPRQITTLAACAVDEDGYITNYDGCAYSDIANALNPEFRKGPPIAMKKSPPRRRSSTKGLMSAPIQSSVRSARGLRPRDSSCGDVGVLTGETAVPGPATDGLQITQPATPNAVTSASPDVTPVTDTNTVSDFATADSSDLVVVLKNSGTLTVAAINVQADADQVNWQIDRDPNDIVDTGTPSLSGSPGTTVTFSPSKAGNFRLTAYLDVNGNASFDEGEQLAILRIAVVQATLQTGSTFAVANTLAAAAGQPAAVITGGPGNSDALTIALADYLLEGGGSTSAIGTGSITVGDVGNLINDTFAAAYPVPTPTPAAPGNVAGTETENPGSTTPMVDSSRVAVGQAPTGGVTPFRGNSAISEVGGATGRTVRLASFDDPGFAWDNLHPTTNNPWGTTSGVNAFREFVVAFSSSFPRTYVSLNRGDWTVTVAGSNDGTKWVTAGATVTGDASLQAVGAATVQVLGLSFVSSFSMTPAP